MLYLKSLIIRYEDTKNSAHDYLWFFGCWLLAVSCWLLAVGAVTFDTTDALPVDTSRDEIL